MDLRVKAVYDYDDSGYSIIPLSSAFCEAMKLKRPGCLARHLRFVAQTCSVFD
jgi:hypothetical protein